MGRVRARLQQDAALKLLTLLINNPIKLISDFQRAGLSAHLEVGCG